MANNYTEFSVSVPLATPAECEWVKTLLAKPPESLRPDWCDEDDCELEFEWVIEASGKVHELIIYTDSGEGNADKVEEFFKLFLADAPTKLKKLGAEFCFRSSRPRPGEFGGAAVVVWVGDDGEIQSDWLSTQGWLEEKLKA